MASLSPLPLLLATACCGAPMTLEVMTFNVQQPFGTDWDGRKDRVALILSQEAPDLIGTQEAHAYQRDYLLAKNPGYAWFGEARDGGGNGEAAWILYRKDRFSVDSARSGDFWLSSTPGSPSRFGGSYNRICTYVRLVEKATGRGIYLFNAHFYTQDQTEYRLKSARMVIDSIKGRSAQADPVILTGDFNSPESDTVTRWFKHGKDNPLPQRDTYREFDPTGPVTTGFGTKFDYVYVEDKPIHKTTRAWVVKEPAGASDHMPTSSALEIGYSVTSLASRGGAMVRGEDRYPSTPIVLGIDGRRRSAARTQAFPILIQD